MASKEHRQLAFRIGARIKTYRKAQKMSQAQLAFECQLTRNTIVNIERGLGNPRLNTLISIAGVLSVSLRDLLADKDNE